MKKFFYSLAVAFTAMAFTACSDSNDPTSVVTTDKYKDKTYGIAAVLSCAELGEQLEGANTAIQQTALTTAQENDLKAVLANVVDNVIIPTYTKLADNTETLESTLNGLDVSTITQEQIDKACQLFGNAREQWELSEAFLGGAASDFSVDPTIDSWPLSRSALLTYLSGSMTEQELEDADESILGFHALEFILFRNGQPRKVAEFRTNDTYSGFEKVSGAKELKYAQQVCKLLKERTFQLQVAWEGATTQNVSRAAVVEAAGLDTKTIKGYCFGDNLKNAGDENVSTFPTIKDAIEQVLSAEEGSAYAITNEVGTAKIGHPFSEGQISYVESPYSYRSIIDFQDNIRSVRNVWYGTLNGAPSNSTKSFYTFFSANKSATNNAVINSFNAAISAIGNMPAPFVKYCCTIWNKVFSTEEYEGEEE